MVCKYWNGTTHVDCGGNVRFIYDDSVEEIKRVLHEVVETDCEEMLSKAKACKDNFLYSYIAKKAIGLA